MNTRSQVNISDMNNSLTEHYEAKLCDFYENKIKNLTSQHNREVTNMEELKQTPSGNEKIYSLLNDSKAKNNALIRDFENLQDSKSKPMLLCYRDMANIMANYRFGVNSMMCNGATPCRHTPLRDGKRKRILSKENEERNSDYTITGTVDD